MNRRVDTSREHHEVFCRVVCAMRTNQTTSAYEALHQNGFRHTSLNSIPCQARMPQAPVPVELPPRASGNDTGGVRLSLDFKLVEHGARQMALIHGAEKDVAEVARQARRRGLVCALSAMEMMPKSDPLLGQYANLSMRTRPAQDGSGAWRALFISKNPELVALAWLAELAGWDEMLGLCLGYPSCCVKSFARRWPEAVKTHAGDPGVMELKRLAANRRFIWQMNVFARYSGRVLVDHFPCCFDCAASEHQAKALENILSVLDPSRLADIRRRCSCAVMWTPDDGVQMLHKQAGKFMVKPPVSNQIIASQLTRGINITVLNQGTLQVGNRVSAGHMVNFDSKPPTHAINKSMRGPNSYK